MISCEASLEGVGVGTLELTDEQLIFYVEKGFFTKRREVVREINLIDIRHVKRDENEIEITWKGIETFTDVFSVNDPESLSRIYESISKSLEKHRKTAEKKAQAKQKRDEIAKTLNAVIKVINSLFDMLISFDGRINWSRVDNLLKRIEERFNEVKETSKEAESLFKSDKLRSAIENRSPEKAIKEAYDILQKTYGFFRELTSVKDKFLRELHPNYNDAAQIIEACYVLNDVILGVTVADEKVKEEVALLIGLLETLAKNADLKEDVNAFQSVVEKMLTEEKNEKNVTKCREEFEEQIKELLA